MNDGVARHFWAYWNGPTFKLVQLGPVTPTAGVLISLESKLVFSVFFFSASPRLGWMAGWHLAGVLVALLDLKHQLQTPGLDGGQKMETRLGGKTAARAAAAVEKRAKRVHKKDAEPAAHKTKTMPEKINMHTLTPRICILKLV